MPDFATPPPPPPDSPPPEFTESDFLPELTVRETFAPTDFKSNFSAIVADFPGGSARSNSVGSDPYLGSLPEEGLSQNVVELTGCGVNGLHVHPRGTESVFMLEGASPVSCVLAVAVCSHGVTSQSGIFA